MGVSDPVADMLTKVRNAIMAKHENVDISVSKLKLEIIKDIVQIDFTDEQLKTFSAFLKTLK
jgi:ribosomal protein S8